MNDTPTTSTQKQLGLLLFLIAIAVAAWYGFWRFAIGTEPIGSTGEQFVNFSGGAQALFAALAFGGLLFTIRLQQKQMAAQEKELQEQRMATRRQMQEDSFFRLLGFHQTTVEQLSMPSMAPLTKGERVSGRTVIDELAIHLEWRLRAETGTDGNDDAALNAICSVYETFYAEHHHVVGHYFRQLYHAVRFVDDSDLEEKKRYTSILRAQLSTNELLLLFYNVFAHKRGENKFKPLLEEYAIFEQLETASLPHSMHACFYKRSAFGDQEIGLECSNWQTG